jgi:isoleucyl-tRNA synthetase
MPCPMPRYEPVDSRQSFPELEEQILERWREHDVFGESVLRYIDEWNRLTERIGFWIDTDDAYFTLDDSYVESVWWTLKQVWDKGLLYEGHKVGPYCPRCGTGLSSHEVALGYKDVVDPSVYVRFPLLGPDDEALLVWTTTPWTLPGNVAVAVAPEVTYVRARSDGETLILAESLVSKVLGEDVEVVDRFPGSELVGRAYAGPIFDLADREQGGFPVIAGDFVTTDDGTGLVHIAPAFGEDDYTAAAAAKLFDPTDHGSLYNPVRRNGTFDERVVGFEGRFVKDSEVTAALIADLDRRGLLHHAHDYRHSYPHCWRCDTPLLYYAKSSWYIRTTEVRDRMLAENETIGWHPEHIKHGRFGKWLEGNQDWALSRERYWGTPLPIWRSDDGDVICIGSREELAEYAGSAPEDLHRPYIDDVVFEHEGRSYKRVPDLIDVWWDSGAMPFAQWHYPFENGDRFEQAFPADYICEGLDQTRGWFYSLLAISTMLNGRSSYERVLCLGLILDAEGQKMSKSKGNVVVPWDVLDQHGADAFRWYYFTAKQPWDGYRFSLDTVGESVRQFMKPLWNTYSLFALYANVNDVEPATVGDVDLTDIDRWILSRLQATTEIAIDRLDGYDTTTAGRAIAGFVDELSNWYVRRSRRRFWDGDAAAFATLRECLVTVAKLLAPLTPFVADAIYGNLDGSEPSVHLCDYPQPDAALRDEALEWQMGLARDAVELGRAARSAAKAKVRQPLKEAVVVAAEREREAIGRFEGLILEELNVKQVRYVSEAEELGRFELKPNYRTLGPRFGKQMPQVAAAVSGLEPDAAARTLREGGELHIAVDGHDHALGSDDVQIALQPLEGYEVERSGSHAVALNLELDDDLRREALAREIVHAVQNARKDAGLEVEDRIALTLSGDEALLDAIRAHEPYVTGETLATSLDVALPGSDGAATQIEGRELLIGLSRA